MSTFNRNEEVQIYHNAINLYGEAIQTIVAIEEINELILALTNLRCGKPSNVEEETADVEIVINQLCIINDIELFEDMPVKPVEVNVACLSSELIITLTELVQAITRGNGEIGEVVTPNAKFFDNLPGQIPFKGKLIVRGEAVISYSDFDKINE